MQLIMDESTHTHAHTEVQKRDTPVLTEILSPMCHTDSVSNRLTVRSSVFLHLSRSVYLALSCGIFHQSSSLMMEHLHASLSI